MKKSNSMVKPVLVLAAICLVMSLLLAVTNSLTAPVIEAAEKATAEAARTEVMPQADSFVEVRSEKYPDSIVSVYKASNGCGYVVQVAGDGYGGKGTLSVMCGIDSDGLITSTKVLSHSETAGLGSKVAEDDFRTQFDGRDSSLEGIDTISGATISSNHYIDTVADAFAAYEIAKEAE